MLKNLVLVSLLAIVSCNNTQEKQSSQQNTLPIKHCINYYLSADEETRVRSRIQADDKTSRIASFFERKAQVGFNGNVLVAQEGVILYQKSFGMAQLDGKVRDTLTAQSKFQLASLSKTFTAIATLQLCERGKMSLEDSVRKFLPEFPYSGIQIKSLLSHRSGLPNYAYVLTDSVWKHNKFPKNADILRWYSAVCPKPYNTPNRYFSYSNTNYALLASIIERVSGQTFENYLRKNIFEPLGMKNTWLVTSTNDSLNQYRTTGYQYKRRIPKDNFDDVVGDKGIYSTTEDLYRWYLGLTTGGQCILGEAMFKEAFTPRSFEKSGIRNYGYGFRMHTDLANPQQAKYVYHTGWWKGYNTLMWFDPVEKFVVIILTNRYNRNIYQIKPLLEILHGRSMATDSLEVEG